MPDKVLLSFIINNESKFAKKLDKEEKLPNIRILLDKKLPKDSIFTLPDGSEIDIDDEDDYKLSEIIKEDKIYIKSKSSKQSKNEIIVKAPQKINTPIPGSKLVGKKGDLDIYLYPRVNLTNMEMIKAIVFMVVGQTGCGKTTLLNSFLNFVLGIKIEDNFRYVIIHETFGKSQSKSQTRDVSIYNIKPINGLPPIQIIDTPGFGDTGGIKQDMIITSKIEKAFKKELNSLNAICFVTESSNVRLTIHQKYIFTSVLDLFGDDVKENFIAMLTFCDGGIPNVVATLEDKDCVFSNVIPYIKKPWFYKFNNSAIFASKREDEFTKMFFKLGMKSFEEFTQKLITLPRKSLTQTKQVLDERRKLESCAEILTLKLRTGLDKIEYIKGILKMVSSLKGDLNDSKNFTKVIKTPKIRQVPVPPGLYMTTCMTCSTTCHKNCGIADDSNKRNCDCIEKDYCKFCRGKCHWTQHKNRPYYYEDYMEEEVVTLNDLKKKYCDSKSDLDTKTQLLIGAKDDLINLNIECINTQDLITKTINRLQEIALQKTVFESSEEHIDLLIENEKSEHKEGWQTRIEGLELLKQQKKMLREIYHGENQKMNDMRKFIEDSLIKEKNLNDPKATCSIF
jgi:GTP-binding protein EngB required for normal cell division